MLKKIAGVGAVILCTATLAACSGSTGQEGNDTTAEQSVQADVAGTQSSTANSGSDAASADLDKEYDYSERVNKYKQYVTLPEYDGVEVTKIDRSDENVSDEEVQEVIDGFKEDMIVYDEITDAPTQDGDLITMNFAGTVDGEAFDGGTAEDYEYTIGSGELIEGFDEQLVGKNLNEEFEINAKFPDDYYTPPETEVSEETEAADEVFDPSFLNGKDAIFTTTITKIQREHAEELSDEWVVNHKEDLADYGIEDVSTLDELKAKVKSLMEESNKSRNDYEVGGEAYTKIQEQTEISEYPEEDLTAYIESNKANLEQEFEQYKSLLEIESVEDYVKAMYDIDGDDPVNQYATENAKESLGSAMTIFALADAIGIKITEGDVKEVEDQFVSYYQLESVDSMYEQFGEETKETVVLNAIYPKLMDYLAVHSNPVLDETDEATDDSDISDINIDLDENTQEDLGEDTEQE